MARLTDEDDAAADEASRLQDAMDALDQYLRCAGML